MITMFIEMSNFIFSGIFSVGIRRPKLTMFIEMSKKCLGFQMSIAIILWNIYENLGTCLQIIV